MLTALVLVFFFGGLMTTCLTRLARPAEPDTGPATEAPVGYAGGVPRGAAGPPPAYPESMTAELDPEDEEYLAWLADRLWPDDEYLETEPDDGELR